MSAGLACVNAGPTAARDPTSNRAGRALDGAVEPAKPLSVALPLPSNGPPVAARKLFHIVCCASSDIILLPCQFFAQNQERFRVFRVHVFQPYAAEALPHEELFYP